MRSDLGWNGLGGFSNDGSGIVKLDSVVLNEPVPYIDLVLPEGYGSFHLEVREFKYASEDSLAAAVSYNNGAVMLNNPVNGDNYQYELMNIGGTGSVLSSTDVDSLISFYLGSAVSPSNFGDYVSVDIFPGSDSSYFRIRSVSSSEISTGNSVCLGHVSVNPSSLVPPGPPARINLFRLQCYGDTRSPPLVATNILAGGSYNLWGVLP